MIDSHPSAATASARSTWIAHVLGGEALRQVVAACDAAGIDVLPVKGIITGRVLYRDVGERPIGDVDVRVRPGDLARLLAAGRDAGWRLREQVRAYGVVVFEVAGRMVDCECHVGPPGLCGLTVDEMIARSTVAVGPLGFRHREPELHDHVLLLAVNAFKDKLALAFAPAIRDLEVAVDHSAFEPAVLVDRARAAGAVSLLWIVADFLARARASDAWRAIRDRLGPTPPRPLYTFLYRRAFHPSRPASFAGRLLARAGSDHVADRLRALVHAARHLLENAGSYE